jgi:tetratricopeptide (TPR) repeat protein
MGAALLLGAWLLGQVPASPRDDSWTDCRKDDADSRIKGCSAVILAAAENPHDLAEAYHNRGNANRSKQFLDLALQDYNNAIRLNPAFAGAFGDRGVVLVLLGRFAEAIPDFTQAIERDPANVDAIFDRGIAYEVMGLADLAIEDFSAAIALGPRDARRLERRGTVYFRNKNYDKALADYDEAVMLDPQYAPALYGRGIVKRIQGDAAGGTSDVANAKRLQPNVDKEMALAGVKEP